MGQGTQREIRNFFLQKNNENTINQKYSENVLIIGISIYHYLEENLVLTL